MFHVLCESWWYVILVPRRKAARPIKIFEGGVDGNAQQNAKQFVIPAAVTKPEPAKKLGIINEDEEEDEDDDSDHDEVVPGVPLLASAQTMELQSKVFDGDIPQEFTHWTSNYTQREMMVCDLQGQQNIQTQVSTHKANLWSH